MSCTVCICFLQRNFYKQVAQHCSNTAPHRVSAEKGTQFPQLAMEFAGVSTSQHIHTRHAHGTWHEKGVSPFILLQRQSTHTVHAVVLDPSPEHTSTKQCSSGPTRQFLPHAPAPPLIHFLCAAPFAGLQIYPFPSNQAHRQLSPSISLRAGQCRAQQGTCLTFASLPFPCFSLSPPPLVCFLLLRKNWR